MKFAEFETGRCIVAGPYLVTEDEIVDFAQRYDRQWFHVDAVAAGRSRFSGLIASGWHTCAMAMRLLTDAALHDSESFASPGIEQIRWPRPVRPGDALSLTATVLDVRRSRSKSGMGILRWRWQLRNQTGAEVLDLTATSLFDLSPAPQQPD